MTIGERIRALREKKGMTLEELGKYAKTQRQTIYKYENNIITNIPSDKIELMAAALNVSPAYLMGWEEAEEEYYYDPQTQKIAQEIFENRDLRALFDASRNATPEDLKIVKNLINELVNREKGEDE